MPGNIIPDFMVFFETGDDSHPPSLLPGEAKVGVLQNSHRRSVMHSFSISQTSCPSSSQSVEVLDGITAESDIPKLFAEYEAIEIATQLQANKESQESEGPDHKPQRLFDSVLPQIFGYMVHGVSMSLCIGHSLDMDQVEGHIPPIYCNRATRTGFLRYWSSHGC